MTIFDKIKENHILMMIICGAIPLIILFVAVRYFKIGNSYWYWLILLLCPLSHIIMMKYMHQDHEKDTHKDTEKKEGHIDNENKKGGACH